jgi:hypothetical protein
MGNATGPCYGSSGACALLYNAVQAITFDQSLDSIQTVPNILLDLPYILADAWKYLTLGNPAFQRFHFENFEPFPVLYERQRFEQSC